MRKYKFLDEHNFRFICQGLTLDSKDMDVLDHALVELDKAKTLPSRIVKHNEKNGFGVPPVFKGSQVILSMEKLCSPEKGMLSVTAVTEHKDIINLAPSLHINLTSLFLDIPQRIEVPLRFVLKGLPKIDNTYMVYLHILKMEDDTSFVYYGITKRGWMKRFKEHVTNAMRERSPLLFARTLREGILGRIIQLYGTDKSNVEKGEIIEKVLVGNHHVVCAAGLTEEQALETEEYLVKKYSFNLANGLNMIPGGKAGIAYLHMLNALPRDKTIVIDEDKERILTKYIEDHPRKGMPNPLVAEYWRNDVYAHKVICGRDGRLSVEQVQLIREAAGAGFNVGEIKELVNAKDDKQVKRVMAGKTYSRIH